MPSDEPWMGLPPKIQEKQEFLVYLYYCSEEHEEVSWRSREPIGNCWFCNTEHRKRIAVPQ